MNTKYTLSREVNNDLVGAVEDAVSYICSEHMISGELAWTVVETFATAKLAQFNGTID